MDDWISMHDLKILKKQSQMEERDKIYKCENCDQEFGNKEHLQKHHNSYHHKKASRKMEESKSNVIDDSYVASDEPNKIPKKLIKETILESFDDYESDSERDLSSPTNSALCNDEENPRDTDYLE